MILAILIVWGICLGSFINALIWRLHKQEERAKKSLAADERLSILRGRSMCTHCHHVLAPLDLVPALSWLVLGGKCRYCRKPIEDGPFTELLLPTLFVASYVWWPVTLQGLAIWEFGTWLVCLTGLLALAVYDLRWMLLPDRLVAPLSALAALQVVGSALYNHDLRVIAFAVGAVVVISGLFYLLFQLSAGKWIGGGDVKLGVVLGLLVGTPPLAVLVIFLASLVGIIVSLPAVLLGKKGRMTQIPFGPYLIAATVLVKLFGDSLLSWYVGLFS